MLTKTQLTAQELHRWLGLVEELTERYAKNTPEDDAKFMAILRLVDDVERWKQEAVNICIVHPGLRLLHDIANYTYGAKEADNEQA